MQSRYLPLWCSQCGTFMGVLTLGYIGVPYHGRPVACCDACLPKRFEDLRAQGFPEQRLVSLERPIREGPLGDHL